MIAILDYGAGNLRSVQNTLDEIGAQYAARPRLRQGCAARIKIILPGVGHFGQMMRALDRLQVRETLLERIHAGVPFLGICLGLQALFERSEEAPDVARPRHLSRHRPALRHRRARPAHGLERTRAATRLEACCAGLGPNPYVYFAHSYYVPVIDVTAATCTYTRPVHRRARIAATSSASSSIPRNPDPLGLQIVRNFVETEC